MTTTVDLDRLADYADRGLITRRDHPTLPLAVWNYTAACQYSRAWDDVTSTTRGLVTDEHGTVVAPCIPKFFNLGETDRSIGEFVAAYEKLDGSLIHVFWFDGRWVCSSRGSFESEQAQWAAHLIDGHDLFDGPAATPVVYVAELIHPANRIVVDYGGEQSLRLLSTFVDDGDGWSEAGTDGVDWPWGVAERIELDDLPGYLDQSNIEGVVLVDPDGGRIKIKTDEYVEYHRIVTGLTAARVVEHYDEHRNVEGLLAVAPDEWHEGIASLAGRYQDVVDEHVDEAHDLHDEITSKLGVGFSRKDYALTVKDLPQSAFLFALLDGRDIRPAAAKHVADDLPGHGLALNEEMVW